MRELVFNRHIFLPGLLKYPRLGAHTVFHRKLRLAR